MVFRVRQKAIAQWIELINALRSHLYEFGYIAPVGLQNLPKLAAVLEDETSDLPAAARTACRGVLRQIKGLGVEIAALDTQIAELSKERPLGETPADHAGRRPDHRHGR